MNIFVGKTLFEKLWYSLDKRDELDLRFTKEFLIDRRTDKDEKLDLFLSLV